MLQEVEILSSGPEFHPPDSDISISGASHGTPHCMEGVGRPGPGQPEYIGSEEKFIATDRPVFLRSIPVLMAEGNHSPGEL